MKEKKKLNDAIDAPGVLGESIIETGKWLEIDGETIVGVHSHRCLSALTWVKYEGDEQVRPGDQWVKNRIVKPKVEINEDQIRFAARKHITKVYPVWKQLNIIRDGNEKKIEKMSSFIDAIRKWSNNPKAKIDDLQNIKP